MIVTAIRLFSNDAQLTELSLDRASLSHSYILRDAKGLDADDITPRFYALNSSVTPKPRYYNQTLKPREVVLKIMLNPQLGSGQTYSSLRDALYKAISPFRTSLIELRFMNGASVQAVLSGFITKMETVTFSQTPEVTITIRCDQPMLRSQTPVSISTGALSKSAPTITDSISTAPHGFVLNVQMTGFGTSFNMSGTALGKEWSLSMSYTWQNLDQLWISSEDGNKYIYVVRSGVTTHLMDRLTVGSVWPIIFPGANPITISPTTYNYVTWTYYNTFWGV